MNKQIKITLLLALSLLIIFTAIILICQGIYSPKTLAKKTSIISPQFSRPETSRLIDNQNINQKNNYSNVQINKKNVQAERISVNKSAPISQNSEQKSNQSQNERKLNNDYDFEKLLKVTLEIDNLGSFIVPLQENDTAWTILLRASYQNNFSIKYENYRDLGVFIYCLNNRCNNQNYYWFLYYNGKKSAVGASSLKIKNNDTISWRFEKWP